MDKKRTLKFLLNLNYIAAGIALLLIIFAAVMADSAPLQKPTIKSSKDINVLVLDTGIYSHPKLKKFVQFQVGNKNYNPPRKFPMYYHGTHITGVIIYGRDVVDETDVICDKVKIYSCNGLSYGAVEPENKCLEWALNNNMNIINLSGGGEEFFPSERAILKKLSQKNVVIITSAGNTFQDLSKSPYYPGSYSKDNFVDVIIKFANNLVTWPQYWPALKNIYVVGNGKSESQRHPLSNYGEKVDIWEDGADILSILPDGKYGYLSGTSQSAALVTHRFLISLCKQKGE